MALHLYRRHRPSCKLHPAPCRSSEFEERKKGWIKCDCPITASGVFPSGEFSRKSTGEWEWDRARAVKDAWEKGEPPKGDGDLPSGGPTPSASRDITVEDATRLYLEDHKTFGSAKGTILRYQFLTGRVKTYSSAHGVSLLRDWTKLMVRDFAAFLGHGPVSTQKSLSQLKSFFGFCQDNGWIEHNPAQIRRHRNRATETGDETQRLPYTDAEIRRMYDAADDDEQDFIALALHTGLRRRDLAGFHIERLNRATGEIRLRTTKYGTHVCTWIEPWLSERIQERAARLGPKIFATRYTSDPALLGRSWYARLEKLWERCGPWERKPNLHRFRHTFVRIMLEAGHSPAMVADLVGDHEQTIRKHYSAWVKERQDAVTQALRRSFINVPRPQYQGAGGKVIAFEKPRSA